MTKIFLSCTISVGLAPLANYYALRLTVEPQPAGPTFARSARVNGTCTTYERIYIYIYIKNIYIYITFIYI